ncbi:MAG: energy transducer TonB [Syntrophaceae bacterium]|nr:energy transducer TonB [Syntrophaceae bacterium]
MACAGTQLAKETSTDAVCSGNFHGSTRLGVISGCRKRWWPSWLEFFKETAKQGTTRVYFSAVILNVALLLASLLATALIFGSLGMLHQTKITVKKKGGSDIRMLLPEKKPPPPVRQEEETVMKEPEQIYRVKKLQDRDTKREPPKFKIDAPLLGVNPSFQGIAIAMNTWETPKGEYGMGEVDQVPIVIFQIPPDYPYHAKRQGIEGVVSIRFLVTGEGTVSSFSVLKATPEGVFDEAARRSVLRWKFRPGMKNGMNVNTWVEMDIEFELG